ncbi:hypothetical protein AX777_17770 [Sphingobium yanoikuyae]|uniref:Uncharacterized protein n=1 Tax=Sphingobium yanoikuyae TaxID=13690 RepID=A0A177JYE4_SPHYA|nr:hypothetical protein [Sphingobium yanoikuyae]OAH45455.1 hypothetical protein AX777_17770 [Sphingobium yanoikuyae]
MAAPYVARFTRLHPQLWAPYSITAYPHGFHGWPEGLADPVWIPTARVITNRGACKLDLGDCPSLDEAIDACWRHFASLS